MRRLAKRGLAALAAACFWTGGAFAQSQEVPQVISPLRVETDHNNVNIVSGKTTIEPPALAVPGAPNLRYDRVQNAAPYARGTVTGQGETVPIVNWSVHTGGGSSESFVCADWQDCRSITGTGSTFRGSAGANASGVYRQAGSGAVWTFNLPSASSGSVRQAYASHVAYPSGEVVSYTYDSAVVGIGQTVYRATRIDSSMGYHITIAYQSGDPYDVGWGAPSRAAIYNSSAPSTPLGELTYNADGTISDLGDRVYRCTGCNNALGADLEVADGTMQLPGDPGPSIQAARVGSGQPLVGSVVRDGIGYSYAYSYNGGAPLYQTSTSSYLYTQVAVAGPSGFSQVYRLVQTGPANQKRNVVASMTDPIARVSSFQFDDAYRPILITYPEGNAVRVLYDDRGNIIERRAYARPGTGLADIVETALYPDAPGGMPNLCTVACWRATWSRDALGRQTDYLYNASGQLIQQDDPADASGVRRRTIIDYATSPAGISRRSVVRVCGAGTTCGTDQEIRTEYQYLGNTLLPTLERRRDLAAGTFLDTVYAYDSAGRLLSTDGPLDGSADTSHNRYDIHGRLAGTISADPDGAGPLPRLAVRNSYDGADRLVKVETGTLDALQPETVLPADWPGFTVARTLETQYDANGRKTRETLREGAAGTIRTFTQFSHDSLGRLDCTAVRMNPAAFGALEDSFACTLGPAGSDGPDRITRNIYDSAGQRLQLREGVGVTGEEATEATWAYNGNGQIVTVIDGSGNRAELRYDGHMRQDRWTFPGTTRPSAYDDSTPAAALASAGAVNAADYEEYGYDAAGNRLSLRRRDGSTLAYHYDDLDRLILKIVPERPGLTPAQTRDVHYGYDLRNLQLYARFDSPAGPGITNQYDAFGRLTASTANTDGSSRTLAYQYDPAGRRTRITHPDTVWFGTSRDTLGRPYWLASADNGTCYYQAWFPDGLPGSQSRCDGSSTWVSRDGIGRLNGLGHYYGQSGAGDATWLYDFNPASQIRSLTRDNDAYAWTGHHADNRGYTTNGLNQYVTAGSATFGYDANGNMTSDGARTYVYDVENRLVSAAPGGTLDYDPLGRLYRITATDGTITRFLYDGDALVGEYDAAGEMTRRYVHWDGADVPLVSYMGASLANPTYLHADHQGSIVAISGASGVPQINRYDEYGIPGAANAGRFQYTGQVWLAELGLYYYKARMYSPGIGRFPQTDPVGYEGGINLYAYVGDDPVNLVDSDGQESAIFALYSGYVAQGGRRDLTGYQQQLRDECARNRALCYGQLLVFAAIPATPIGTGASVALRFGGIAGLRAFFRQEVSLSIADQQLGAKFGEHYLEWGLRTGREGVQRFREIVTRIGTRPERVVNGTFSGGEAGRRAVQFRILGRDVVVTTRTGEFVTLLRNGITNGNVQRALRVACIGSRLSGMFC